MLRPRTWSSARLFAASASVAALALVACGSSGLSQAQLAARANAACTEYLNAVRAVPAPPDFATNSGAAAAYLDKIRPLVHREYQQITSLKPDSSVKADFDRYRAAAAHQLALFDSANAKAHARTPSALRDVQTAAAYKQSVLNPLDRRLGFTACV